MATDSYDEILKRAQSELSPEQQIQLVDELVRHAARTNGGKKHKITDLKGLGKEIWEDVDVDQYVAKERDSWDG